MPFTLNMSGTTEISDALIQLWDRTVYLSAVQEDVVTPVAIEVPIAGKTQRFVIYTNFAAATSPLGEYDDATSTAVAESYVDVSPAEYGLTTTRTTLANLQSGGQLTMAIFEGLGRNLGLTKNALATAALEATTNALVVGGKAEADVLAGDIMSITEINKVYNKLSRTNVPTLPGGMYIAFAHDDVINDIRGATAAGSWMDTTKYTSTTPLMNEVGAYGGFRWVRNNNANFADQTGAGTVDLYSTCFLGANALIYGVTVTPNPVISGPYDKLNRFLNIGWYGVFQYKIYDVKSVWKLKTAASVGANT